MAVLMGAQKWGLQYDKYGHRRYTLTSLVNAQGGGPAVAANCPGLPVPYSTWAVTTALGSDLDLWAFCLWEKTIEEAPKPTEGDPNDYFYVTNNFTTDPAERYCRTVQFEDPLLELPKISGGSITYQEEATYDRFGNPLRNSAFEVLRGPQVEFDKGRSQVKIEHNVPDLQKTMVDAMLHTLNGTALWGFPPRCIKLSAWDFDKKYHGVCFAYYTRRYTFEVRFRLVEATPFFTVSDAQNVQFGGVPVACVGDWDRDVLDEGTKALYGHWDAVSGHYVLDNIGGSPPDNSNPAHFKRFQDRNGDYCKCILNGHGIPWDPDTTGTGLSGPGFIHIEKYAESDFSLLQIPLTI